MKIHSLYLNNKDNWVLFKSCINYNFWNNISFCGKLNEEFIREFKDKINWFWISGYQKLSEEFIREFKDKVYWDYISRYQDLSEEFKIEFKDELNSNYKNYL